MENLAFVQLRQLVEKTGASTIYDVVESVEGEKYVIKLKNDSEKEKDLMSIYGIDIKSMISNVLVNEAFSALTKFLLKKIEDAEETLDLNHGIIVTGARVASSLQSDERFTFISESFSPTGGLYHIGNLGEARLFVDPSISWSQTHALIFDRQPIACSIKNEDTDDYCSVILTVKMIENLKCYVWNCPPEILDRL